MASDNFESLNKEPSQAEQLCNCPQCNTDFVHPTGFAEIDKQDAPDAEKRYWAVDLRCNNCGWEDGGVYSEDEIIPFDEQIDDAIDAVRRDYKQILRHNMAEEISRFVTALNGNHLLPEDF